MSRSMKLCEACIRLLREGGYIVEAGKGKDKERCDYCRKKVYARPVLLTSAREKALKA